MTVEQVYDHLCSIKERAKEMTEESFDKTKAFKFVYANLLDVIDSLEYVQESCDLFDDSEFDKKPTEKEVIVEKKPFKLIDEEDLM